MQKVLTLTATCLLGILLCASAALADEVKTDHFTLNLPSGWTQPQPVQSAQGATMAILQNAAEQTVITVAVTPVPLSAKDLAIQTIANMKAAGFTTSEPVASGDSYVGEFSKEQVRGVSYFSANGKLGSVITIMGASLDAGKKMLKDNLKPADSKLFPMAPVPTGRGPLFMFEHIPDVQKKRDLSRFGYGNPLTSILPYALPGGREPKRIFFLTA